MKDTTKVTAYYHRAFYLLKKRNCRAILTWFISVNDPKKRRLHPYTGDKPRWWPEDVRYLRPDALLFPERIKLLINILRTPGISINKLRKAPRENLIEREISSYILDEIVHIRNVEIFVENTHTGTEQLCP
jgi:hypothetical protein